MAEGFNNYFSEVGALLADKIESSKENTFKTYMSKRISLTLFLNPTNPAEVFNVISSLKTSKSGGYDNISSFFLKSAKKVLVFPLAHLFNCSFKLGIFPGCLKVAKVLPVYKSGEKSELCNYRPISILSSISKVLEKLIHIRSSTFLNEHSILLPTQYGFRANQSTIHDLLDVITSSYDNINNSKFTALVLLDLRKAFDTVNHNILLNKLEHYGIHGVAHKFFSSFLSNRCQYVSLNNKQSTCKKIACGVPQGSVLGPLLFTMYINDINSSTSDCPKMFANDTCLILQDNTLNHLYNKVSSEISSVNKWMAANKLTLNLEKSNVIIINPKNSPIGTKPNTVSIHQHVLPSLSTVSAAKYLGVVLDDGLSFKTHINMLTKRLSRAVGVLSKVKLFPNKSSLLSLYYGIFHSHLQYGILA